MSFEIFDANMPIENASFLPHGQPAGAEENREPALEAALQQAGAAAGREPAIVDRQAMREAMREASALDLWIERAGGPAFTALDRHEAGETVPLRKLNPDELALLAGGSGSEFDVWGNPYWDWNFPNNDPGDQYPGGAGSPGGTDYLEQYYNECQLDSKVDSKAQEIANLIKTQPDWNEREYAAVIYMVNGEVRVSALQRGMTVAEAVALGLNAPRTDIYPPSDLGDGIILAVIHSHPDVGYDDAADVRNRYPSGHAGGDYDAFDALVGIDPRFSNNAGFAQYILGPDGLLREFNAKDGRLSSSNDPNPNGRTNLAADRPCET